MILAGIFIPRSATLTIGASPSIIYETVGSATGTVGPVTITPTTGVAPYTYSWVVDDDGSAGTLVANTPTSNVCSFDYAGLASLFDTIFATLSCTVTDLYGTTSTIYLNATVTRVS